MPANATLSGTPCSAQPRTRSKVGPGNANEVPVVLPAQVRLDRAAVAVEIDAVVIDALRHRSQPCHLAGPDRLDVRRRACRGRAARRCRSTPAVTPSIELAASRPATGAPPTTATARATGRAPLARRRRRARRTRATSAASVSTSTAAPSIARPDLLFDRCRAIARSRAGYATRTQVDAVPEHDVLQLAAGRRALGQDPCNLPPVRPRRAGAAAAARRCRSAT